MLAIGVDPGTTGAIAVACSRRGVLAVRSLPTCPAPGTTGRTRNKVDGRALADVLAAWSVLYEFAKEDVVVAIERMQPFGMGDKVPAASLLSMGYSAGLCEGVIARYADTMLFPLPLQWKPYFQLAKNKELAGRARAVDFKKQSIAAVYRVSPTTRLASHDQAEAVLLALWALGDVNGKVEAPLVDDYDPMAMQGA